MKRYEALANALVAMENCRKSGNAEWLDRHGRRVELIMAYAPSGSGFDNGTRLIHHSSDDTRLTFETDFHHMNDVGVYDGWTSHRVTVRPSFIHGFVMTVYGRNRNDIKDYIADAMAAFLSAEWQTPEGA